MKKTIHFRARDSEPVVFNSLNPHAIGKHGLFDPLHFRECMDKYGGAELVNFFVAKGGRYQVRIYHIEPQGITVRYEYNKEGLTTVDLYGGSEGIGKVERIILEAAERFEKPPVEVPA